MKTKIIIMALGVAGFLFPKLAYTQMHIGPNTYILVSNHYLYITQALELNATTSHFYLRKEGQLLQGTSGSGANTGMGALSVFQEGTVNNFQYNYWCSPVGNRTNATTVNNAFGISQLGSPNTEFVTTSATILASNIFDGTANPFAIAPYWIYKFIAKGLYSDWVQASSATTIAAAEGFTMKGSSGTNATTVDGIQNNPGNAQRYDFRGKPNDGTINIPVLNGEWTLTGNPYPSAINLPSFLIGERNCTGIAYFWQHDKTSESHYIADYRGGYATYSGSNIYVPAVFFLYDTAGNEITSISSQPKTYQRQFSPIGQGFMIEGSANGNVQMKNSYRVFVKEGALNNSEFDKKANDKTAPASTTTPQIRFNTLLDNGPVSQMVLAFDPVSTDGVDRAMDAAYPNEGPANNYFVIQNNEYTIEVVPFDINKKIAVGFRNLVQANYKIKVIEMLNIPEVANVYLHDKTANLFYDIKNSLHDLTLPAGTNNTQYEITFKNVTLGVDELVNQSFVLYQNNTTQNLMISNPMQKELASCSLYDISGKLMFIKNHLGTDLSYVFPTSGLSDGVYVVKLIGHDNSELNAKIIIKN